MYIVTIEDTNISGKGCIELYFKNSEVKEMLGTIGMIIDRGGETIKFGIGFIPQEKE